MVPFLVLRMERRGPKRQSIGSDPSADVCGADCKEQRHGEEPAEALRWELSREEMQDWADHELAKLFHPDAFAASQDHQVAPETAVGPAGPNKAKQPVRDPASAKIDPST